MENILPRAGVAFPESHNSAVVALNSIFYHRTESFATLICGVSLILATGHVANDFSIKMYRIFA